MHWAMLKLSKGQGVGPLKEQWYHFARNYSLIALRMYGEPVDDAEYEQAVSNAEVCRLEKL